jgi:hypothetical protein
MDDYYHIDCFTCQNAYRYGRQISHRLLHVPIVMTGMADIVHRLLHVTTVQTGMADMDHRLLHVPTVQTGMADRFHRLLHVQKCRQVWQTIPKAASRAYSREVWQIYFT